MIPEKLKQLIILLTDKTQKKKAIWDKASGNNQFKLSISDSGIAVTINEDDSNWNRGTIYEVTVFNSSGYPIERFASDDNSNHEDFGLLKAFHKAASDQYYKVEETMDAILNSITNQEIIGKLDNSKNINFKDDDDVDLPF
ncbi:MAG: hypothetical protein EOP34_09715 [Rickettsiales bacterium]|nr:MAG: hypothetical protein EOP34_09715 [Rickettsiales bacterium]